MRSGTPPRCDPVGRAMAIKEENGDDYRLPVRAWSRFSNGGETPIAE
ncbi:hypothetical protein I546_2537 [Mycobacterium kansasii 732]|nr:hypothetical protein I546_2537 [Mycobacterium kansasii 732]